MRQSGKSGDETPVMSAILNHFDFAPKTHRSSGDCRASLLKEKTETLKLMK